MQEELALLAVTRMLSGFCIAGVNRKGEWHRPVKPHGALLLGDIRYRDGGLMRPFDRVQLELERAVPDPPHVEDWSCNFLSPRPALVGRVAPERLELVLEAVAEPSAAPLLQLERSLILLRAQRIGALFRLDPYSGKYEARIRLPDVGDERGIPCTDLRWRALGRSLVPEGGGTRRLNTQELWTLLGAERIYVALGLARAIDGRFQPLVVGVHSVPEYEADVDPEKP